MTVNNRHNRMQKINVDRDRDDRIVGCIPHNRNGNNSMKEMRGCNCNRVTVILNCNRINIRAANEPFEDFEYLHTYSTRLKIRITMLQHSFPLETRQF